MTHVKLPAGFEDWVEVSPILRGTLSRQLTVTIEECVSNSYGMVINTLGTRHFAPPKPKPVLPDVKPGAVIRFTHKSYGTTVQAVKWRAGSDWHIQFSGVGRGLCETYCGDAWLLENVDANGFTVELEGL